MGPFPFPAMSYTNTFIRIAPDSARETAVIPPWNPDKRSVASLQHELLTRHPGELTEKELYFQVHCQRLGLPQEELDIRREGIWRELFAKPQACLRASPLPKSYGWGIHYDPEGRVRLVAVDSPEYRQLSEGTLFQTAAMRSKRAQ